MAHSIIVFKHSIKPGKFVLAPVGFSFTTLFFGPSAAFLRKDFTWGAFITISTIFVAVLSNGLLVPVLWYWFASIYNKRFIVDLIEEDYVVVFIHSDYSRSELENLLNISLDVKR